MHGPFGQWCPGKYHHALSDVCEHSLEVGPITDLMGSKATCVGLGNAYTRLLGYVVIWVQVDRVWGYDEDQIALVIPDLLQVCSQSPCYPWNAYYSAEVVNVMREAEMDALAMPWVNARVAHLLLVCRMMTIGVDNGQEEKFDVNDYDSIDVYPESGNHRALLFPYSICKDREGLCRRTY